MIFASFDKLSIGSIGEYSARVFAIASALPTPFAPACAIARAEPAA